MSLTVHHVSACVICIALSMRPLRQASLIHQQQNVKLFDNIKVTESSGRRCGVLVRVSLCVCICGRAWVFETHTTRGVVGYIQGSHKVLPY